MTGWTRVKDKDTGHEYTVAVVNDEAHEVLDNKAAVDRVGRPLPVKLNRPLSELTGDSGKAVPDMTVPELREYAAVNEIDLGEAARKDQIVAAIAAAQEGDDPAVPDGDPTPAA